MPAWQKRQPRVHPRKISTLIRSWTLSASGTSGCFGYGHASRLVTVCLDGTARHVRAGRGDPRDTAVGGVVHVVEAGHVRQPAPGQLEERLLALPALGLGGAEHVGDAEDRLLPVAEHDGVEEVGDRLGVERGMAAGDDERMLTGALATTAAGFRRGRARRGSWCSRARSRS